MTDSAFWKTATIFLMVSLLGVYLLYEWYDDRLYEQLAEKNEQLERTSQQVVEVDQHCHDIEQKRDALAAEIETLSVQHADETRALDEQLQALSVSKDELEQTLANLRQTDETALAALTQERDQAVAAQSELEARYQEALAQIDSLQTDLSKVQKAISEAAAEHRAHVELLERHLNQRIELATVTPKDEELMRIAREVGALPAVENVADAYRSDAAALNEVEARLSALQTDYDAAQRAHAEQVAELENALAEARASLENRECEITEALMAKHAGEIAALQQQLNAATDGASAAAETRIAELEGALETSRDEQTEARESVAELAVRNAEQAAALKATETRIAELEGALESSRDAQTEARESVAELAVRSAEQTAALKASEARIAELQSALDASQTEQSDSVGALTRLTVRNAEQTAELTASKARIEALTNSLAELRRERDRLQAAVQTTSAPSDAAQPATAEASGSNAALQNQLTALQTELERERTHSQQREAELRQRYRDFSELGAIQTERGILLRLANTELRFPPGGATLPDDELPSLDKIAALLTKYPEMSIRVEGHTDDRGSDAVNLSISEQRANAVMAALISRGLAETRISAEGIGSARPITDNATAAGRARNRRVELYVIEN